MLLSLFERPITKRVKRGRYPFIRQAQLKGSVPFTPYTFGFVDAEVAERGAGDDGGLCKMRGGKRKRQEEDGSEFTHGALPCGLQSRR